MRKWLLLVFAFAILLFPTPTRAQNAVALDAVNVRLWSEYDQPSMLVLYDLIVSKDTQLPAKVTLRFPKDGNLIAVAYSSGSSLLNANFDGPQDQGDWKAITLIIDQPAAYHIEYYQPLLRDGNTRRFTYEWPGDYSVKNFSLELQLPKDVRDAATIPALPNMGAGAEFFTGSTAIGSLNAGLGYKLQVTYQRAIGTLSKPPSDQVQPSQPINDNTPGRVSNKNLSLIIGISAGAGLILIIGVLFYYFRSNQSNQGSTRRRRRPAVEEDEESQMYCHECGTRARAGDRFCRTCGSKLRIAQE